MADKEGIDGHQIAAMAGFDVAFPELGAEAFQVADLLGREFDLALGDGRLQAQQALVLGGQTMAAPDPAHPAGGDLNALQHQLLGDPEGAMGGMIQAVVQDRLLDRLRDPVGVRPLGPRQAL